MAGAAQLGRSGEDCLSVLFPHVAAESHPGPLGTPEPIKFEIQMRRTPLHHG